MNDVNSLSHSKWRCKYHIVFASYCICNGVFIHTSLCEFHQGKLLFHLTISFEEKPKTNLPGDNLRYYRRLIPPKEKCLIRRQRGLLLVRWGMEELV